MRSKPRSRLKIIADILDIIERSEGGIKITALATKSNVPYAKLTSEFLAELLKKQLIENCAGNYKITIKGAAFLAEYRKLENFMRDLGLA